MAASRSSRSAQSRTGQAQKLRAVLLSRGFGGSHGLPRGLESVAAEFQPDRADVDERVESIQRQLLEVVETYLPQRKLQLKELVKNSLSRGEQALWMLADPENDSHLESDGAAMDGLEAIVASDGSRPSFMVRFDEVDLLTSPAGEWKSSLENPAARSSLTRALRCVGRIDVPGTPQGFVGTGFLIEKNLILTNRHVLQVIGKQENSRWQIRSDVSIDFGHEHMARASVSPRRIVDVVFAGSQPIDPFAINHGKLDLALLRLETVTAAHELPLAVDVSTDWNQRMSAVYVVGYPGDPPAGTAPLSVLELLFRQTFGCKRLAPGQKGISPVTIPEWTMAHDATTLGGNSGSVTLVAGREKLAAGLHYGGRAAQTGANWAHKLGGVLNQTDGASSTKLGEQLRSAGVELIDSSLARLA